MNANLKYHVFILLSHFETGWDRLSLMESASKWLKMSESIHLKLLNHFQSIWAIKSGLKLTQIDWKGLKMT